MYMSSESSQVVEQEVTAQRISGRRRRSSSELVDRANWAKRPKRVSRFLELCLQQKRMNKGTGSTFKPEAWTAIQTAFNSTTFRENGVDVKVRHNVEQFKSLLAEKREQWENWCKLKLINSGFGWDNVLNRTSVSDDVWNAFVEGNPWAAPYRDASLPADFDEWDQLFRGAVATGTGALNPADAASSDVDDGDDDVFDVPDEGESDRSTSSQPTSACASSSSPSTPATLTRTKSSKSSTSSSSDHTRSRPPKLSTGQQLVRALERLVPDDRADKSKVPQALNELDKNYATELLDEEYDRMFLFLSQEANARMFLQFINQKAAKSLTMKWLKRCSLSQFNVIS